MLIGITYAGKIKIPLNKDNQKVIITIDIHQGA